MDVPILDFSLSREGVEPNKQQAFHDQFIGALSYFGFVKLINYGVDESLIYEAFDCASTEKRYFALPDEVKAKAVDPGPVAYRGWIRPGQENAGKVIGFRDGKKAPKAIKPDIKVEARYSMAMFGKANRNVSVATLPEFKVPGLPEKYDDITAWQYQKKKTEALYV
ncbi:hypothetical protein OEA41_006451 [Lepraria neglecta]|uniref:Non-haem dioxygenase N-terminal domain-containing protein n=1 Tax=Lepraria neglecta TaxID=209136 RepID=A0AAD9ZB78_9LECA|nr:hypothetical protein OEA41_006451 [Lepraria neglecta]